MQYVRMETNSSMLMQSAIAETVAQAAGSPVAGPSLRVAGRPDLLTAQRIEVSIILQAMLGTSAAAEYLESNAIDQALAHRVLHQPHLRRGCHDASGIRC
ncbi:MAG: hypothetical protein QFF03_16060 [Pseudomonadota bacterium]|nr:hypothetical protein [Pseudomonadota bacterium]